MGPGTVIEDYTTGTGLTWDTLSSTVGTGQNTGIATVVGGDNGGVNAVTDGSGNVTLSAYIPAVDSTADLPGNNLPTSVAQVALAYVRGSGLYLYDPAVGAWAGPL